MCEDAVGKSGQAGAGITKRNVQGAERPPLSPSLLRTNEVYLLLEVPKRFKMRIYLILSMVITFLFPEYINTEKEVSKSLKSSWRTGRKEKSL